MKEPEEQIQDEKVLSCTTDPSQSLSDFHAVFRNKIAALSDKICDELNLKQRSISFAGLTMSHPQIEWENIQSRTYW